MGLVLWWANVQFPQLGCGGVVPSHDDGLIVTDGDLVDSEGNVTAGIAALTNGQKRLCCQVGHNVAMSGSHRKPWDVYFHIEGGMEDGA